MMSRIKLCPRTASADARIAVAVRRSSWHPAQRQSGRRFDPRRMDRGALQAGHRLHSQTSWAVQTPNDAARHRQRTYGASSSIQHWGQKRDAPKSLAQTVSGGWAKRCIASNRCIGIPVQWDRKAKSRDGSTPSRSGIVWPRLDRRLRRKASGAMASDQARRLSQLLKSSSAMGAGSGAQAIGRGSGRPRCSGSTENTSSGCPGGKWPFIRPARASRPVRSASTAAPGLGS